MSTGGFVAGGGFGEAIEQRIERSWDGDPFPGGLP
jgi:hypothetical protein